MAITKKQIIDDVLILLERFSRSDDSRANETWIGFKIEQIRVSEILNEYNETKSIDQNWLMDFGIYDLTKVNIADDPQVTSCECDIMKVEIPETINLTSLGDGNLDLGLKVLSACGKTQYTFYPLEMWRQIPKEHVRSKFHYYQRFGTTVYINKLVNKLRFFGIPATTEGLMIKKTLPVISGAIKNGYSYAIKGTTGMVTYNGVNYLPGQSFTATVTTTFTASGNAQVFYTNFEVEMTDKDPYPVSAHLARRIVISILTTEFQIEKQQVADVLNDSADDVVTK